MRRKAAQYAPLLCAIVFCAWMAPRQIPNADPGVALRIDGAWIGEEESELRAAGWGRRSGHGGVTSWGRGWANHVGSFCYTRDGRVEEIVGHRIHIKEGMTLAGPGEPPDEKLRRELGWTALPSTQEAMTPRWGPTTKNWATLTGDRVSCCHDGEEYCIVSKTWSLSFNK